jgi:hypothetical protein
MPTRIVNLNWGVQILKEGWNVPLFAIHDEIQGPHRSEHVLELAAKIKLLYDTCEQAAMILQFAALPMVGVPEGLTRELESVQQSCQQAIDAIKHPYPNPEGSQ